jgi:hypothetical protein
MSCGCPTTRHRLQHSQTAHTTVVGAVPDWGPTLPSRSACARSAGATGRRRSGSGSCGRPRAKQEIDYGRRDVAGYVFGALQPATGAAFTATFERRSTANWVDFLSRIESWIAPAAERVYAVVDNLNIHGTTDVLLFALAHPRWEFVFQPKYAAYLNLIEPWWKVLRSLALKGRRFEAWAEIEQAVARATTY